MLTAVITPMPASKQLEHVLIALLVAAAGDVGVRQLVDDTQRRLSREDGVEVHFLQHHAAVVDPASRHDLEIADPRLGIGTAVGLDESDHDVDAFAPERVRVFDHRVGLADARRGADVDAETGTLIVLQLRQRLLARGATLSPACVPC